MPHKATIIINSYVGLEMLVHNEVNSAACCYIAFGNAATAALIRYIYHDPLVYLPRKFWKAQPLLESQEV